MNTTQFVTLNVSATRSIAACVLNHKHICRYHQDLYYEEDEDSEFETLMIPSDEETRHLNEVPVNTGSKKGKESTIMTQKPKIPPKPRLTPSMDLSQLNNTEEQLHKKTTLTKKEITTSLPAVKRNEVKSTMSRSTSLQHQAKLPNSSNTMNSSPSTASSSVELQNYVSNDSNSSLLNNVYQPPNLSNLKYGEESLSPSPEVIKKGISDNLSSPVIGNTGSHSSGSVKEDGEIFRSLSIDSAEQDEVESVGDDDVMEKSQDGIVDIPIPVGDEETAKGELLHGVIEVYVKCVVLPKCTRS